MVEVGGAKLGRQICLAWIGSLLKKSKELSLREGRDWGEIVLHIVKTSCDSVSPSVQGGGCMY